MGGRTHHDTHRGSRGFETRRGVQRVPGREAFARVRIDIQTDERLPGVHPNPDLDRKLRGRDVSYDPQRRENRPLGIILVSDRDPKQPNDGVSDELLHHSTVGFDPAPADRLVVMEQARDVFGIQTFPKGRGSHEIAEEGGDHLAFLANRNGLELGSALVAEPRAIGVDRAARVATHRVGTFGFDPLIRSRQPHHGSGMDQNVAMKTAASPRIYVRGPERL